jgi:hypothetical protein
MVNSSFPCFSPQLLVVACSFSVLFGACRVQAADASESGYSLRVRPSICVSYNSDEPCRMDLRVSWEGPARAELCLRELMRDPLLQCWQNAGSGSVDIEFGNNADVLYQLQDSASQDALAESPVTVINRDLRNSRKRRRHVWSIL